MNSGAISPAHSTYMSHSSLNYIKELSVNDYKAILKRMSKNFFED